MSSLYMTERYLHTDFQEALRILREGGIILYPTDTIWGIGCDATNPEAVARIYRLKEREDSKSMLVLMDAVGRLQGYVDEVPDTAWQLLDAIAPDVDDAHPETPQRPLTIIYPGAKNLAHNLIAEDGSIGIRITNERFSHDLCAALKHPLVSTSANISGQPSPQTFAEIDAAIRDGVDYVCLFRQDDLTPHLPSSIIKIEKDHSFRIIR